jgi:indole-3-glycerol phosphate synthase
MFLERIVQKKREDVARAKKERPLAAPARPGNGHTFFDALAAPGISLICEFKRRSPSKGPIRIDASVTDIVRRYQAGGASALSILTETHEFAGSPEDLVLALGVATIPILRKDFIVDPYQILETAHLGAAAYLLIVSILEQDLLVDMVRMGRDLGLEPLIEVHDAGELDRALASGGRIIGINNRDLRTFEIDPMLAEKLIPRIPAGMIMVAESGYSDPGSIARAHRAGAKAFLIGESLMRSEDPGAAIRVILDAAGGSASVHD